MVADSCQGKVTKWESSTSNLWNKFTCIVTIQSIAVDQPKKVVLEKPDQHITQHIKPLFMQAHDDGKPVNHVLVDNESTVNVMPLSMVRRLPKSMKDLKYAEVSITNFVEKT